MNQPSNRFRTMGSLADSPESQRYLRRLNGEPASAVQVGRELTSRAKRTFRGLRNP